MIVALDPGRNIGVAFVSDSGDLLKRAIVDSQGLAALAIPEDATVLVGDGTGSNELRKRLEGLGHAVEVVLERSTSLEARQLYFRDHSPRGLQRLLPVGMRSPPVPIDDYAAYAIVLRWLQQRPKG